MTDISTGDTQRLPSGLEVARWLYEQQKERDELVKHGKQAPHTHRGSEYGSRTDPLLTRVIAKKFGVPQSSLARQLKALKDGKPDASSDRLGGRPTKLTDTANQILSFHIYMLQKAGLPVSQKVVRNAVGELLARRDPPGALPSKTWILRWWAEARNDFKQRQSRQQAVPQDAASMTGGESGQVDRSASNDAEDTNGGHQYATTTTSFQPPEDAGPTPDDSTPDDPIPNDPTPNDPISDDPTPGGLAGPSST
ncbi:Uu.00g146510.m01.CDS01 [Anthostomella pinea]|uniref:Uu.00g146510.m01.CDS01 n=1 Tax=Anthostomella pinea TaxID=933095 RepID=A0AAI8VKR4_9PEZI|nr:Uu.00g146510.m01.CDS01 [Anthostomella pinea]